MCTHLNVLSYPSPFSPERLTLQVDYLLQQGWTAAIEHSDTAYIGSDYWDLWNMPLFGSDKLNQVLSELNACQQAYPDHHVRLVGFDARQQTVGMVMLVK